MTQSHFELREPYGDGFLLTEFPNLELWTEGDFNHTFSAGDLTALEDRSGKRASIPVNGTRYATIVAGGQNGHDVLRCAAAAQYTLTSGLSATTVDSTIIAAYKLTSAAAQTVLAARNTVDKWVLPAVKFQNFRESGVNQDITLPTNSGQVAQVVAFQSDSNEKISCWRSYGSTFESVVDDTHAGAVGAWNSGTDDFHLFGRGAGLSMFDADVFAVAVYLRKLATLEINQAANYMRNKWIPGIPNFAA